ncbi:hypothetical protein FA95DRAFT_1610949 [Auriscalpium vulgare]|uniref:Uncharacterized protein n=1 Tax=Auriscalpium vulgare TaxID=40419 RepID=A0ACB8RC16_9AGAM|nr:hypothetical protein FA95DRAFT_1610949 [Auriscalpium vulgare]
MPKRALDDPDASPSLRKASKRAASSDALPSPTPSKRLHTIHTSTPARSAVSSSWSTPATAYSVPSDSPSNPFGFKRSASLLELPKPTSFSKQLPLRFQFISPDPEPPPEPQRKGKYKAKPKPRAPKPRAADPDADLVTPGYEEQGTYRIVQVPLSYTFRHLHALVLFLFGGDPGSSSSAIPGHLFEAQKRVIMHPQTSRPGEIKTGRPWLRLSRVRDPYYSSQGALDVDLLGDVDADADTVEGEGAGESGWRWDGEDDITLAHIWPRMTFTHAIIYHHDAETQVHISISSQSVPHRKGVGNTPYVFRAFGRVRLDKSYVPSRSPSPPPRLIFPRVRKKPLFPSKHRAPPVTKRSEGPGDTEVESSDDQSRERTITLSTHLPDFDGGLDTSPWNRVDAFQLFLARMDVSDASNPRSRSHPPSRSSPSSLPDASSPRLSSASSLPRDIPSPPYSYKDASSSYSYRSSSPPAITPAPSFALTRFRVRRAERRIELVKRGISEAESDADDDEGAADADAEVEDDAGDDAGEYEFNPFADVDE